MGSAQLYESIDIKADVDKVWESIEEFDTYGEWNPLLFQVKPSGVLVREGSEVELGFHSQMSPVFYKGRCCKLQTNRTVAFEWDTLSTHLLKSVMQITVEIAGFNQSHVVAVIYHHGILRSILRDTSDDSYTKIMLKQMLHSLRRAVESTHRDSVNARTGFGKPVKGAVGIAPPQWRKEKVKCENCDREFGGLSQLLDFDFSADAGIILPSLDRNRHHCRACGRMICDVCSNARCPVSSWYNDEPQRICVICVDSMLESGEIIEELTTESHRIFTLAAPLTTLEHADIESSDEERLTRRRKDTQSLTELTSSAKKAPRSSVTLGPRVPHSETTTSEVPIEAYSDAEIGEHDSDVAEF